jgi:c(7)-type cytochrome triheme protein
MKPTSAAAGSRMRSGVAPALVVTVVAVAVLVAACTTANPAMTFLFDGVPAPGEERVAADVVKQPRRLPYKKPAPKVTWVEIPDAPPVIDWKGKFEALPRDDGGNVAWSKALDEKLITPKPGLADDAKDEEPTDMDTELATSGQAEYKVMFPHKAHTQWMACPSCHTGIFEMEHGKTKMTMTAMNDGQQCGVCHGKVASPELTACPACHKEMGK